MTPAIIAAAICSLSCRTASAIEMPPPPADIVEVSAVPVKQLSNPANSIAAVLIEPAGPEIALAEPSRMATVPAAQSYVQVNQIINTALKVWDIVKKNEPVVNVETQFANAMPQGVKQWEELAGWMPPQARPYGFSVVNTFNMEMAKIDCRFIYSYGGNYKGKGHFLTGVTIDPATIKARFGYKIDLSAHVISVVNVGSEDNPVAGITFSLDWKVSSVLQKVDGSAVFFVDGNGNFNQLTGRNTAF